MENKEGHTPEQKHTPGPWKFVDEGVYETVNEKLGGGAEYSFAFIKFNGDRDYVKKYRELIARAPELLSEVERLNTHIEALNLEKEGLKSQVEQLSLSHTHIYNEKLTLTKENAQLSTDHYHASANLDIATKENSRLREERKKLVEALKARYEHLKWLKDLNTTKPETIDQIDFLESLLSKFDSNKE